MTRPQGPLRAQVQGGSLGGRTDLVALSMAYPRRKAAGGRAPLLPVVGAAGYLIAEAEVVSG